MNLLDIGRNGIAKVGLVWVGFGRSTVLCWARCDGKLQEDLGHRLLIRGHE